MDKRLTIGLTGGIASGKTTISQLFAELGITIIDTDVLARTVVEKNEPAYHAIVAHFGQGICDQHHNIDRRQLREIIFADPNEKEWLEKILHPEIRQRTAQQLATVTSAYSIAVIPLLFETWPNPFIDRVLVIDCSTELQLQRLMTRDHITKSLAETMLAKQASRTERLSIADDVIENTGDKQQLHADVLRMHTFYLSLAETLSNP